MQCPLVGSASAPVHHFPALSFHSSIHTLQSQLSCISIESDSQHEAAEDTDPDCDRGSNEGTMQRELDRNNQARIVPEGKEGGFLVPIVPCTLNESEEEGERREPMTWIV